MKRFLIFLALASALTIFMSFLTFSPVDVECERNVLKICKTIEIRFGSIKTCLFVGGKFIVVNNETSEILCRSLYLGLE